MHLNLKLSNYLGAIHISRHAGVGEGWYRICVTQRDAKIGRGWGQEEKNVTSHTQKKNYLKFEIIAIFRKHLNHITKKRVAVIV